MSKTQEALALYDCGGMSIHAAARAAGIKAPTLHAAIKRREAQRAAGKGTCPCCGQVVRDGFAINQAVLKDG